MKTDSPALRATGAFPTSFATDGHGHDRRVPGVGLDDRGDGGSDCGHNDCLSVAGLGGVACCFGKGQSAFLARCGHKQRRPFVRFLR